MATGRPIKLTEDLQKRITDIIRAGNYMETAAAFAGISKNTLYDWMKRGARERERIEGTGGKPSKKEKPFLDFSDAVEKAMAEAEIRDVMQITNASKTDWKAAAWRLERKFPQKWGKKFQQIDGNEDERRLKLLAMELAIQKQQLELDLLRGAGEGDAHDQIEAYRAALTEQAADVFAEEGDADDTDEE